MSFRATEDHLRDILEAISNIEGFVGNMDYSAYLEDLKTRAAVERQFSILSEAGHRLGPDADAVCPGPDWSEIRGIGNVLRHEYHRTSNEVIWNAIKVDLPPLKTAVTQALATDFPQQPE